MKYKFKCPIEGRRWNDKFKLYEDMCADFERMDRRAK